MKIISLAFFAGLALVPSFSNAASVQIDLDATFNTARFEEGAAGIATGNLISLDLAIGDYTVDVIAGVYTAYQYAVGVPSCNADGAACGDGGWTINYNVFDSIGVPVLGYGIGSYQTPGLALSVAQGQGSRSFFVADAGMYYISISDGITSGTDNSGGVSLLLSSDSISEVPLPASGLLLLAGLGGLYVRKRSKNA